MSFLWLILHFIAMRSINTTMPVFLILLAVATAHTLKGHVVVMDGNNSTEIQEVAVAPKDVVEEGTPLLRGQKRQKGHHGGGDDLLKMALQNPKGSLFYAIIDVGTPPMPFRVSVDSGSSNLWLMDERLESSKTFAARGEGHVFYNKENSKTHKNYKKWGDTSEFVFPYGDESEYQGDMAVDVVWLEGKEITGVEFGVVSRMNPKAENVQSGVDGLLGIGLQANAFNKATTLLATLKRKKIIDQDMFSIYVTPGRRSGWLILGGVDNTMHSGGEIKFHHIINAGGKNAHIWALQFDTLQFGGGSSEEEEIVVAENFVGELDCGATDIYAPKDVMEEIRKATHAWFQWNNYLWIECGKVEELPPLSFVVNGQPLSFSGLEYFSERVESEPDEGELCQFFMTVSPDDMGRFHIGIPFFEKYYTVFNASGKKQRIGFAEGVDHKNYNSPSGGGHAKDDSTQKKRRSSSHKKSS